MGRIGWIWKLVAALIARPLGADAVELVRLAFQIADEQAWELVDSSSVEVERDGERWRDLADREFDYLVELESELRYLELAGLLRRHPTEPRLVQLIEGE